MPRTYAVLGDTGKLPMADLPSGLILLWRGDKPPEGWLVCDGQNGTPDLSAHTPKGPGYRLHYIVKT